MDLNTVEDVLVVPGDAAVRDWQAHRRAGDALLGGGTWLFSEPQPDARRLVDLSTAGWAPFGEDEDGLTVAATATIAELAAYRPARLPISDSGRRLVQHCCEALVASFKVWNVATVGGNLCLSLPAGSMTSLAAALDGTCVVWTPDGGVRTVPALDFVTGDGTNVLAEGEVLRAVTLPAASVVAPVAFRRGSLSTLGRSAALVIGRRTLDGRTALTVTAATRRPVRLLVGPEDAARLPSLVDAAVPALIWHDDVHGRPDWRRHLTLLFAAQVVAELSEVVA